MVDGSERHPGRFGKEKKLLPILGIELYSQILGALVNGELKGVRRRR
jgi:hypothetical protein